MADQFGADGKVIAESAKAEPLAQSGLLDLDPSDGLEVARGYPKKRALSGQVVQHLFHARHADEVQIVALFGDAIAHGFQNGLCALFHHFSGNAGLLAGLAENGRVCATVKQNAGQGNLEPRHPVHAGGK